MDGEIAIAVVAASAPGVQGEAESALDRPGRLIAARMPVLLPFHQLGGNRQLVAVDVGARFR